MKQSSNRSKRLSWRYLHFLLLGTMLLVGCNRGQSEHYSNAREAERKLLIRGNELNYADPGYLRIARELEQVPLWSEDYDKAQEKLKKIKDARRINAGEQYQLDYLPDRLEGVALASLAPPMIDTNPVKTATKRSSEKVEAIEVHHDPPQVVHGAGSSSSSSRNPDVAKGHAKAPKSKGTKSTSTDKTESAAAEARPVILYTTSWCGFCRKTRSYLRQRGVEYIDKDVERDANAAREMARKAGRGSGVPVIDIDGTIIRGFDVQGINRALARRKKG